MAYQPDEIDLKIHKRAAQLLGGEAAYQRIADEESKEVMARWNQNTELIGRILRAHLFVEQFLTDNLRHANPRLGSIERAKLGFSQKIDLLDPRDPGVAEVTHGKIEELKPIELLDNFARFAAIALSVRRSRLVAAVAQATHEIAPHDGI